MSKQDERDYANAKQQLSLARDPQALRVNDLCEKSIAYHEWVWNDDPEVTAERRAYLEEHPAEFKVRWASSTMFIRIMAAGAAARNQKPAPSGPRNITPEQLAKMNLSPEQLAVLSGIENYEKPKEIEVEAEKMKEREVGNERQRRRKETRGQGVVGNEESGNEGRSQNDDEAKNED